MHEVRPPVRRPRCDGGELFYPTFGEPYVDPLDGHVWVDLLDPETDECQVWRLCDLVADAFLDVNLLDYAIYHLDGDVENNRLDNLGWRPLLPGQLPMSPNE